MWREGGMRPSREEHHFTSLSFNFLCLPSFSEPFIRWQVIFTRRIKEKHGENARTERKRVGF